MDLSKSFDHSVLSFSNKTMNTWCQYKKSCLVCKLLGWQEKLYKNY